MRKWGAIAVLALVLAAPCASMAEEMFFRLVPIGDPSRCKAECLELIAAEGEITDATPQAFLDFIERNLGDKRVRSVVLFHSPGGDVRASMNLGMMLRRIGAATVVARAGSEGFAGAGGVTSGRCYSACVYALMGGKKRVIPAGSRVGIHRSYSITQGPDPGRERTGHGNIEIDPGSTGAAIARYSDRMGVSRDLIDTAQKTLPDDIHIVTPQEIQRWKLGSPRF